MSDANEQQQDAKTLSEIRAATLKRAACEQDPEQLSKLVGIAKAAAEARNEIVGSDVRFWATTLTPLVSVLIAVLALIFQGYQFGQDQVSKSRAQEDTDWREAMKSLNYDSPDHQLATAMSMKSFFDIARYGEQARAVAASTLPAATNVGGFDSVWFAMLSRSDLQNQIDLVDVAQKVALSAWQRWEALAGDGQKRYEVGTLPFVKTRVNSISPKDAEFSVDAWKLGSISKGLVDLWTGKTGKKDGKASPQEQDLSSIVLENVEDKDLSQVNFTGANLTHAALSHVAFHGSVIDRVKFDGAVILDGVDFGGVTHFEMSSWKCVDWRKAKLSKELQKYLEDKFPYTEAQLAEAGCRQ